jgi:hypothetical protein
VTAGTVEQMVDVLSINEMRRCGKRRENAGKMTQTASIFPTASVNKIRYFFLFWCTLTVKVVLWDGYFRQRCKIALPSASKQHKTAPKLEN